MESVYSIYYTPGTVLSILHDFVYLFISAEVLWGVSNSVLQMSKLRFRQI